MPNSSGRMATRRTSPASGTWAISLRLTQPVGYGRNPCRRTKHHRHRDCRQRRMAGCLSRCWNYSVPWREGVSVEGGWRVPGIMWWPGHIEAGRQFGEMMSHIDCWSTLATMAGITPPPHGEWKDNNGKPIYFDSIAMSFLKSRNRAAGLDLGRNL